MKFFTLIELLVVVAIIGILTSMLLPSLGTARLRTKAAVCVSNLRSQGQAMTMLVDNGSPSGKAEAFPGYSGINKDGDGYRWFGEVALFMNSTDTSSNPYLNDINEIPQSFKCPTDDTTGQAFDIHNLPYGYNYSNLGEWQAYGNSNYDQYAVYISEIKNPSEMIVITDSNLDGSWDGLSQRDWATAQPGFKHFKKTNMVFVDGHASGYTASPTLSWGSAPYFRNAD